MQIIYWNPNDRKYGIFAVEKIKIKTLILKIKFLFRSAPTAAPAQPVPDQNGDDDKGDENQVTFCADNSEHIFNFKNRAIFSDFDN